MFVCIKYDKFLYWCFLFSASDLESIRALFNEKEKELSMAVAKVEELTRQLEELRRGRNRDQAPPTSALELDKLRRELMVKYPLQLMSLSNKNLIFFIENFKTCKLNSRKNPKISKIVSQFVWKHYKK